MHAQTMRFETISCRGFLMKNKKSIVDKRQQVNQENTHTLQMILHCFKGI